MKVQHDKVWFTSDLHFFHKNICKYCNRPYENIEEMNQAIIDNWNSVVNDDDYVFVLGDLGFCGTTKLKPMIAELKGHIFIIQGNHDNDKLINSLYYDRVIYGFDKLLSLTVVEEDGSEQEMTLCHFPMIEWYNSERGSWMIHGHCHQLPNMPSYSLKHWDVGVDKNNMFPISYKQLKTNIVNQIVNELCEYKQKLTIIN